MTKRNAKLNLTSKVARATVFALLFVLCLGACLVSAFDVDIVGSDVAYASKNDNVSSSTYGTISSFGSNLKTSLTDVGSGFAYSYYIYTYAITSGTGMTNNSSGATVSIKMVSDSDGHYANFTYRKRYNFSGDLLTLVQAGYFSSVTISATASGGNKGTDYGIKASTTTSGSYSSVATTKDTGITIATAKTATLSTSTKGVEIDFQGSDDNDPTLTFSNVVLTFTRNSSFAYATPSVSGANYALRNRTDFLCLSTDVLTSYSTYSGTTFSVEPNTANGQTAYASGGREIKMLSTEFSPIGGISGSTEYQFKGSIKGNGCTISGLVIPDQKYSGLFGNLGSGASIENLTVSGSCTGTSTNSHAILAGCVNGTVSITNCTTNGTVKGGIQLAGLVGYANAATLTISNCTNNASVEGIRMDSAKNGYRSSIGGFVGYANANCTITINGSSNSGTITGRRGIGGLVGYSLGSLAIGDTSACTNSGTINGGKDVGGIVGYMAKGSVASATNSGAISGTDYGVDVLYSIVNYDAHPYETDGSQNVSKVNDGDTSTKYYSEAKASMGFVAYIEGGAVISGFGITNANDTASQTDRKPKTVFIFGSNQNDYTTDYNTGGGAELATLQANSNWTQLYYNADIGIGADNYLRKNIFFDNKVSYKYYYIYVSSGSHGANGSKKVQFSEFDLLSRENVGGIVGMTDATSDNRVVVSGATNNGTVTGVENVGGIIGYSKYGNITVSATNTNAITGTSCVGGIFGRNYSASATGISVSANDGNEIKNTGKITSNGGDYIGGIGGYTQDAAFSGTIVNEGEISASGRQYVGGIAGFLYGSSLNSGSFNNRAKVVGGQYTGGIAGQSNYGNLRASYNSGRVEGGNYTGGIIGQVTSNGVVIASVSMRNTAVVKGSNYVGGIFGDWTINDNKALGTFESYGTVAGGSYVGGIFGNLNTNGKTLSGTFKVGHTYSGTNYAQTYVKDGNTTSNTEIVAHSGAFAGGFFGYVSGGSTITFNNGTNVSGELDAWECNIAPGRNTGAVIGSAVGANVGVTLDFSKCSTVPINANVIQRSAQTVTINGTEYASVGMIGGVAGFNSGTIIGKSGTNIVQTGSVFTTVQTAKYIGGIVGYNTGTITNCRASVTVGGSSYRTSYSGGIIGYNTSANVTGVYTNSAVYGMSQAGGYFGYTTAAFSFDSVTHSALVNGWGSQVGGFVGGATGKISFKNCTNTGEIVGTGHKVGGFIGEGSSIEFDGTNENTGNVTGGSYPDSVHTYGDYTGGLVGSGTIEIVASSTLTVNGLIIGHGSYVGGLFGDWKTGNSQTNLGTLEFYGTVAGGSYVGGIAGNINTDSKNQGGIFKVGKHDTYTKKGEVVAPYGQNGGGFFGYATGSSTIAFKEGTSFSGQLDACDNGIGGFSGGSVIGCAVGYNANVTLDFSGCTTTPISADIIARHNNATIGSATGSFLGGVVGYNAGKIIGNSSVNLVDIAGEFYAAVSEGDFDGYVGGVVGYNVGSITNVTVGGGNNIGGSGAYLRAGYTGGIAGYNAPASGHSVSGVHVNKNVYGTHNVGGYFGWSSVGVSNIYHTATVNGTGQYVGGIVGWAEGATFESCYHKGAVTGGTNVGGIVGGGTPTLKQCYVEVDDSNLLTGTTVGGLSGVTTGTYTNSWAIYYGSNAYGKCTVNAGKALRIEDVFKSSAHVYPESSDTNWNLVTSKAVGYFRITGLSVANGNYLGLIKMADAVTTATSGLQYEKPNYITSTANTDGSVSFGIVQYMNTANSVQVSARGISEPTANVGGANGTNNFTYNGQSKVNKTNYKLDLGISYYKSTFTKTSGDDVNVTSGGYVYKVVVCYDETNKNTDNTQTTPVFGQRLNLTGRAITPFDLSSADANYCYNGPAYGMPASAYGNGYDINKFKNSGVGVIEYKSGYESGFYIASAYFNKVVYDASNSTSYTTVSMALPTITIENGVLKDRIQQNLEITFSGSANYTNSAKLYYSLIDSDFGVKSGKTRDNTWGSEDNPFVVSNWIYLLRLSDIVNGTMQPIDSVVGFSKLSNAASNATTLFYDGCYFLVTTDITMPADIIFAPIGGTEKGNITWATGGTSKTTNALATSKADSGKKVTYFGGNFVGDGAIRTIDVGNHFKYTSDSNGAARNYVGLFGYIDTVANKGKAGVKNIALNGNFNGTNYVGGVVGYAKNAVIDSCYINASSTAKYTVGGNDYVGSIAGYLDSGCELYSENASSKTINNKYVTVTGTNYVGGFVGAIEQGAGYDAGGNTYVVGKNGKTLRLVNESTMSASGNYVGGIVGAIVENSSSGITKFAPEFARNLSNISGGNYVGGIVGAVNGNNVISLENAANSNADTWSYNGTATGGTVLTVGGTDYVGGIAGYLGAGNNLFTRVFSTANVSGGSYVGGLVGEVTGGTFNSCFVSEPETNPVTKDTDKAVASTQYAGGLAGSANGANVAFVDCYMQGFKWSRVTASSGGVAGYASSTVRFENSWALYLVDNADFTTVPRNENGKYIVADSESATSAATYYEMLVFAGLKANTSLTDGQRRAVKSNANAGQGIIPLGVTLPTAGTLGDTTGDTPVQIVFYDGSGTETATDNAFVAENDSSAATMIYIYLGKDAESMSVCRRKATFNNVSDYASAAAWQNAYLSLTKPIQYRAAQYAAVVSLTSTAGPYAGSFQIKYIANYAVNNGTLSGTYVFVSRTISFSYSKDNEVTPRIIASIDDWNTWAQEVKDTNGSWTGYVKLTANIGTASSPVTKTAGMCSTGDITKYRFGGTFDGNGYTITVNITSDNQGTYNELSLFPQAAGATFKNLTIAGMISNNGTTEGNDIGAFVGIARGPLTFLNCKNQATVWGGNTGHNTGGLVGTAGNNNVTFIDCVNEGTVGSAGNYGSKGSVTYGVGGIIGSSGKDNTNGTIVLESCRNAGTVNSDANVGGIIGTTNVTCTIRNSANTGEITGTAAVDDTCSGGIAGVGTAAGNLNIYACYNTGTVVSYGNKAGGILGADSESTSSSSTTKIYYCYNTGEVYTGSKTPQTHKDYGVQAGGIIGTITKVDIQYCYNVGTITANGCVVHSVINVHARVGGIAGYADDTATYTLKNCYNVGLIVIGANVNTSADNYNEISYAAGIIGFSQTPFYNQDCSNNYSLKYQVYRRYVKAGDESKVHDGLTPGTEDGGFKGTNSGLSYGDHKWQTYTQNTTDLSYSGVILPSLADFTSAYFDGSKERIVPLTQNRNYNAYNQNVEADSTVAFGDTGVAAVMNTKGTITYDKGATTISISGVNTGIETGSLGGYIYVYGCLPQLACFALDTKNGLAMTSMGYGYDEVNEQYVLQPAGGEHNPYIVKDGIDLMSITAITQAWGSHYDFDDAYIEFADSTNNLDKDICTYINMPTGETSTDIANAYKFANNGGTLTEGKNYHIFKYGAVVQQKKNYYESGVNSYSGSGQWKSRNAYYNGTAFATGAGISTVNYYPVGMFGNSGDRTFKGTIDGKIKTINANNIHQTDWDGTSRAEVRNVKIDRTIGHAENGSGTPIYSGLFAFIDGATVGNIKVSGSITGRSVSSGGDVHVGVVGHALGNSVLDGLETSGLTLQAINLTGGTRTNAVGGIIGIAEPNKEETITIKNCIVGGSTKIIGFAPNIGGIIGVSSAVSGADASAQVTVENCNVKSAIVNSNTSGGAGSVQTLVGGIVGKSDDVGSLTVTGSSVGTIGNTTTSANNQNVKIYGQYAIGGLAGNATAGVKSNMAFIDCAVYGDVLISRTGNTNDSTYGTAIGGIVGYISDTAAENAFSLFRGTLEFHGTIDTGSTTGVKNIGGAVGYMGTSAVFDSITVRVYGKINATATGTENIGGFAGYGAGGTLDGTFYVAPTLSCASANFVGGFIGLNGGNTYITRTSTINTARENSTTGGQIVGLNYVGGFIGGNQGTLFVGAKEALGATYGTDANKADINLYSSVDGKAYVGGFLGRNSSTLSGEYCEVYNVGVVGGAATSKGASDAPVQIIGGIIGSNMSGASITFSANSKFENAGQVGNSDYTNAYQYYVGGVIGANAGAFSNSGALINTGNVYGREYVGGAIGILISGVISGTLANGSEESASAISYADDSDAYACADGENTVKSTVNGVQIVGGVIGAMLGGASIVADTSVTTLTNYGRVTATAAISNAGGIIGLMYGKISGNANNKVVFRNFGSIDANSFAGGIIGVVDGEVSYGEFTNYSREITFKGDTAMGGAIGAIVTGYGNTYYPSHDSVPTYATNNQLTHITNSKFAYQADEGSTDVVTVKATGATSGSQTVGGKSFAGGLGGVIGVINASDIGSENYWSGNSYYVNGNVIGTGVDNVGGLVGSIDGSKVVIDNMLVYNSAVEGRNNVGGIVGYNNSSVRDKASIVNCFNVKGTIVGTSNYGGIVGNAAKVNNVSTYTEGSYWILPFDNATLNKVDPNRINETLSATFTVAGASNNVAFDDYLVTTTKSETITDTDEKIEIRYTTTGGKLYVDANGTELGGKADMSTTLYYKTTVTTTTSTYNKTDEEWSSPSSTTSTTYTAIGTPKDKLNFSVSHMSAHPTEPSALGYASWAELATAYGGLTYNAALGYGTFGSQSVTYSTGDIEHGFFYVYAENDSAVGATISVDIAGAELNQWNIIANTPAAGTIPSSAMTYNNGAIQVGHIYSKAIVPDGTGYYVYFYGTTPNPSDNNAESDYSALSVHGVTGTNGAQDAVYFDWDTTKKDSNNYGAVGNVLIYFKEVVMESGIVYNGQQRYAPITDMTYATASDGTKSGNKSYYYFDETVDGSVNTATDAGNYDVKANIWFRDSAGKAFTIGSVDSTTTAKYKWTISQRDLELTDSTNKGVGTYDGTFRHFVQFTVANSVYSGDELLKLLGLTAENSTITKVEKSMPDVGANSTTAYYSVGAGASSTSANDCAYTVVGGNYGKADSIQTYTYTVRIFFKDAGSHKVTVQAATGEIGKNYTLAQTTLTVQVNKRVLTITATKTGNGSSYEYNGGTAYQGVTKLTITGFVSGEANKNMFNVDKSESTDSSLIVVSDMKVSGTSVYCDVQTCDAATYKVTVSMNSSVAGASNYRVTGTATHSWTISKHNIKTTGATIKDTTVPYDGKVHYINAEGGTGTGESSNEVTWGKEIVTFTINAKYDGTNVSGGIGAVNVGTYKVTFESGSSGSGTGTVTQESGCLSKRKGADALKNYDIAYEGLTSGSATLTITAAEIEFNWTLGTLVYTGADKGPDVSSVKIGSSTYSNVIYNSNNTITISGVFGGETVTLAVTDYRKSQANEGSSYTAKITGVSSASGKNAAGDTLAKNYAVDDSTNTKAYTIQKSIVKFSYTGSLNDKVYDGNSNYNNFSAMQYKVETTNGGASNPGYTTTEGYYYYNGSKVSDACSKTGAQSYDVWFTLKLNDTTNFKFYNNENVCKVSQKAHITPRGLTVTLNDSSGRAFKTFDNDELYSTVTSTSGNSTAKSKSQRLGKGITVENFCSAGITLTANFREEDRARSAFDEYVNGIFSETVDGKVVYKSGGEYNKMLELALSSSDSSYLNYYIKEVKQRSGASVSSGLSESDTTVYVLCKDSKVSSKINNCTAIASDLKIEITKYTVKADYSWTSQSYANADNTYNTTWNEVTGELRVPSSWNLDVKVKVTNGWMKNSDGTDAKYTKYTRIVGRSGNAKLGATLESGSGKELCVTLRNQPTLIIGYFVQTGDSYQIGSVAGLLIATEYYKGNFNDTTEGTSYNFNIVEMEIPKLVANGVETSYDTWDDFLVAYHDAKGEDYDITTHSQYSDYLAISADIRKEYGLEVEFGDYTDKNGKEKVGYYYWEPIEVEMPTYTNFVQVNDFDMIVTALDLQLINEAFGGNWGVGKTFLNNVLSLSVGSVAVLGDSVFTGGFNGSYDGAGYTINHLTIFATVTSGDTVNIGTFAHVGAPSGTDANGNAYTPAGVVTAVNLRNANIQVLDTRASGTLNVGGIVGYNQAVQAMKDCTFHGVINVQSNGIVNVGGIIGKDESSVADFTVGETKISNTPVYGAIVIATVTVTANTANAGGIVGLAYKGNAYTNIVSVSEIYVTATTVNAGGILGAVNEGSATVTNGYYLQNAIYGVNNDTYVAKSNTYGTAKSYDDLYNGSKSNYNNGVMGESATTKGSYDVVTDRQPMVGANESGIAPRESMRLGDIIDTYVLKYEISQADITIGGKTVQTYKKADSSAYVGRADGTTVNRIGIVHQQHLSLISMFNYMNFELKKDITMYTGYVLKPSPEAFIGTVIGEHVVNARTSNAMPFATSKSDNFSWLVKDKTN